MAIITERYSPDKDTANLKLQLQILSTNLDSDVLLDNVTNYLQELPRVGRALFSEVVTLVTSILVMPESNATSERSFSTLRRVKMYYRFIMTQVHLNMMVLHVHWNRLDKMDLYQIGNEFIDSRDHCRSIFG